MRKIDSIQPKNCDGKSKNLRNRGYVMKYP